MIDFIEISKQYRRDFWSKKVTVLDSVSFGIRTGKVTGFLGANGAGKTTSLKICLDFIRPTKGKIKFSNELGIKKQEIFSNIGYLPERPYFYPDLIGHDFLNYMGRLSGVKNSHIKEKIIKWTKKLNITDALDRELRYYSKGMLQRIGLASVLLHEPKLVILDEPLSGLDPVGRKEVKDIITEINGDGKTVFFSSHIMADVEEICQNIIFLEQGKLIYEGSLEELISSNVSRDCIISYRENSENKMSWPGEMIIQKNINDIGETYLKVKAGEKDKVLADIIKKGGQIEKVEYERVGLESILYKLGS